jgi:integration host factor subunit beta
MTDAGLCIDTILNAIANGLSCGQKIELRGFGSFSVREMAARRHASTFSGEKLIPKHGKVIFKPYENLRKLVWNRVQT